MGFWDRFRRGDDEPAKACVLCGAAADETGYCPSCYNALSCSFCGRTRVEVANLIAGPRAYICNDCVHLCRDILVEQDGGSAVEFTLTDLQTSLEGNAMTSSEKVAALRAALALVDCVPERIDALFATAMRLQQPDVAAKVLERVPESDRDSRWSSLMSQAKFDCGDFDGAVRALDSVTHTEAKDSLRARANRATAELAKTPPPDVDPTQSFELDELIGTADDELLALVSFAEALTLHRRGRGARAASRFSWVSERFGDRVSNGFLVLWGECLASIDRRPDAIRKWQKVLDDQPDDSYWKRRAQSHLEEQGPYR